MLHFLQLPVGEETYELTDSVLHANFEYTERGSKVAPGAMLRMQPDLTPIQFEAHGRNYRPFTVDAAGRYSTALEASADPKLMEERNALNRRLDALV